MSFTFGANKTAPAPSFGAQPAGSITFGTPVAQTGPRFGLSGQTTTTTPSTGFQLGANTTTTQSNLFGAVSTPAPLFGAAKPLTFGAPTAAPGGGFGFGTATSSAAPSAGGGLSFGTPGVATSTATSAGLSFGTQSTQSGGLFGAIATPSSGLSFGAPAAAATTSTAPSLGLNFGAASTAAPTLSFGAPATTSTGLNFNFSGPTAAAAAATTTSNLFQGLGGLKPLTTATPTPTTTTTTTPSIGLGGITTQQAPTTTTKPEVAPKEQTLPNEVMQTVEHFKTFIKDQKTYSSEVSRCCVKEYWKMEESLEKLQKVVDAFEVELQKNRNLAEQLKQDTAKGLQDADMAQRTYNTPPGMQYDNVEPSKFFAELADDFERKVQTIKRQIEATNSHLKYMFSPTPLTPEDLALGMKRLHESFIALAGSLQMIHSQVETQKEQYLSFRKYAFHDDRNIFARTPVEKATIQKNVNYLPPKIEYGPTPFNSVTSNSFALSNLQNPPPSYPGSTPLTAPTSAPSFGAQPSSLFGSASMFGQPPLQFNSTPNYNFQLQKPPVGNKRGKQ